MLKKLISTRNDHGLLVARLVVAGVMFPHGAQKLFGWFGGKGVAGTLEFFTAWGFPAPLVIVLIFTESVGALSLAMGFLGRIWAAGIAIIMIVAVGKAHSAHFFMNWYAEPRGEGFEYHVLMVGLTVILILGGSGPVSVDRFLQRRAGEGSDRTNQELTAHTPR